MAVAAAWGIPPGSSGDLAINDQARVSTAGAVIPRALRQRRVLDRVSELATTALGAAAGLVTVVSDDRVHVIGSTGGLPASLPLDHFACAHVVTHGAPLAIADTSRDPIARLLRGSAEGTLAYAAAPVRVRGHVIGTVAVTDVRPRTFTGDDLELLEDLAGAIEHQLGRPDSLGAA